MADFHLAQVNVAYALGDSGDPVMAEFNAQLDAVNALAEASPGFLWRYTAADSRDAAQREVEDARVLFNMSVWDRLGALHAFTYRSHHGQVFAARRKWFGEWKESVRAVRELGDGVPAVAMWWVPAGHRPTAAEGLERLRILGRKGPSPESLTFKQAFTPAGVPIER